MLEDLIESVAHRFDRPRYAPCQHSLLVQFDICIHTVCELVAVEGRRSKWQVEEVDLVDFEAVLVLLRRVLHPDAELHVADGAHEGDRPERPVQQLLVPDDCRKLVEGDARESGHDIVIGDEADGDLFDEEVELHLFDLVALHVWLHGRPHQFVSGLNHDETGKLVCARGIDIKNILSSFLITFPGKFELPLSFFAAKSLRVVLERFTFFAFDDMLPSLDVYLGVISFWHD